MFYCYFLVVYAVNLNYYETFSHTDIVSSSFVKRSADNSAVNIYQELKFSILQRYAFLLFHTALKSFSTLAESKYINNF